MSLKSGLRLRPYIKRSVGVASVMGALLLGLSQTRANVGDTDESIHGEIAEALQLYLQLEFDQGIERAQGLFARKNISATDSVAIYECMGVCTYAKGGDYRKAAYGYLDSMASVGPCVKSLPQSFWPQQLRDKWYSMAQDQGALTCPDEADEGLTTIAFLPFDNFSVEKHQSRLGRLSSALAEFFAYDFSSYSGLKIVERDKLDFLLKEQELVSAGRIDKATAIKVGKIVGAKMMVFGLISQFDDKNARMGVKVVNVETSEIITTVDKEGKPDFNKMQKELVQELAKKLDIKLNEKSKKSLKLGGTDSMEAMDFYARGLEFMDDYDYEQAYQNFKNAYEMDGEFIQAKEKMETYWPLVG